jgi:peptide/nickel transport system permease protein
MVADPQVGGGVRAPWPPAVGDGGRSHRHDRLSGGVREAPQEHWAGGREGVALTEAVAGYFGGILDAVMMRIVDAVLSIPILFLLLVVVSLVTPTEPILILVIALTSWLTTARLVRGEALSLRVRDYVQAMKMIGGGSARAVLRHIAPNAVGTIMVNATFQVADAIAFIVALSYLGLGIRPPQEDWGAMLSGGVGYVSDGYWWLIFPAGLAIVLVIISAVFVGEGLRDAVEVRLQRR